MTAPVTPILVAGAGRMGGALIAGWRRAGTFAASELIVRDPNPGAEALTARDAGARLNPPRADFAAAHTVLLAVKPQLWRAAAREIAPHLAPDAVIVSIIAGVGTCDLVQAFDGRAVALAMPTTAAAIGKGATGLYAEDVRIRGRAHALFEPVGAVVDLESEGLMHAATAASASAPAYLYAFIEALQVAAVAAGLPPDEAKRLARGAIIGAAALLDETGDDPAELRRQVTSTGGTTQAALDVLLGDDGLSALMQRAVAAAVARARELGR
jgi:pyrroline-5-carboxylate reductase